MKPLEEKPLGTRMAEIRAVLACPGDHSELIGTLEERITELKEDLTTPLPGKVTREKRTTIAIYRDILNLLPTRLANLERGKETKAKQTP